MSDSSLIEKLHTILHSQEQMMEQFMFQQKMIASLIGDISEIDAIKRRAKERPPLIIGSDGNPQEVLEP